MRNLMSRTTGPGKFEGSIVLAEALYNCPECADASVGEGYGSAYYMLFTSLHEIEWNALDMDIDPSSLPGDILAAILTEDSQGFVSVETFSSDAEAKAEWAKIEAEVSAWYDEEED